MNKDNYTPFYGWLILFGLIIFGFFMLWQYGFLNAFFTNDQTYLSTVILGIFFLTSLYIGRGAWRLARETAYCSHKHNNSEIPTESLASDYIRLLKNSTSNPELIQARLVERAHSGHGSGWFMSDLLLRLGLIGTVIGFVLMLGSVYELKQDDIQALQQLLTRMGGGMQVALYTTLAGLGSAMLIGIQCHWLDRYADRLVSDIIELGSTQAEGSPDA
ncbi:MAG: MotA/TolQ/ExbB proton channel family protein [Gammaproteobacteria bacterium]|nr:MotA/TolQ/ExbB proton channel family protein [Gammaproteobacteria bacterium]